jgi:hypothetical protein
MEEFDEKITEVMKAVILFFLGGIIGASIVNFVL